MVNETDALHEQLAPLATLLSEFSLVVSEEPERHGLVPAADSLAMAELSDERRFGSPGWDEPVRNAHSYGQMLLPPLVDHLAATAATAEHAVLGPAFSHLTLLRATMEISTLASWLLEPTIGTERRIKRSLTYRIDSTEHIKRIRSSNARSEGQAARVRARAVVDALGWSFENATVSGERLPHAKRDFSRYAFPGSAVDSFDDMLWNFASASGHGTFYALAQPLREPPGSTTNPLDPRGMMRAVVTSAEQIATCAAIGYFAVKAAADARRALMGWPLVPELSECHRRGNHLAKMVSDSLSALADDR